MGKGASAPMLVVFIGTIGGFIANGFVGLFTGAIILSIVYNLLMNWLELSTKKEVLILETATETETETNTESEYDSENYPEELK